MYPGIKVLSKSQMTATIVCLNRFWDMGSASTARAPRTTSNAQISAGFGHSSRQTKVRAIRSIFIVSRRGAAEPPRVTGPGEWTARRLAECPGGEGDIGGGDII